MADTNDPKARRAAQLRANLKRRKAQAKARTASDRDAPASGRTTDTPKNEPR